MLSKLSPAEMTALAAAISLSILNTLDNNEANALNNLLSLIASNLSVQLAQEDLLSGQTDDTPLFVAE